MVLRRRLGKNAAVIAAVSITPLGVGESVGGLVAKAIAVLRASGLPVETNSMFTNVEGEWDQVMAAIKAAVDVLAEDVSRVSVVVKIDHRHGVENAMSDKVASIERRLTPDAVA